MDMQIIWDQLSDDYWQRMQYQDMLDFWYGPFAPGEKELDLLGTVSGMDVLDIGCGAGQNAVALSLAGANVIALDISTRQLNRARNAADSNHASVTFVHADAATVQDFSAAAFDLITCIYTLPYITLPRQSLARWRTLLRAGGRLVFSFDHPAYTCFMDSESNELAGIPLHSYLPEDLVRWPTNVPGVQLPYLHRPLSVWMDDLIGAGFQLAKLVEPSTPDAIRDELWPEDSPLAPIRNMPHTVIFVAESACTGPGALD